MKTGIYQHYKGGYYQVLGIGQHSETGERLVVYISLDPYRSGPRMRIRPVSMWTEVIQWPEGDMKPRFVYIGDEIPN